jgi:hypothetical protein
MRISVSVLLELLRGVAEFAMLQRWRMQAWMLRHGR